MRRLEDFLIRRKKPKNIYDYLGQKKKTILTDRQRLFNFYVFIFRKVVFLFCKNNVGKRRVTQTPSTFSKIVDFWLIGYCD